MAYSRKPEFCSSRFLKDKLDEKMLQKGFNQELPTFTAILGDSYYLTLPVFEETLRIISSITPKDSKIIFDFPDENTFSKNQVKRVLEFAEITEKLGEPMLHCFSTEEIKTALEVNSLQMATHYTPQIIQQLYFDDRTDRLKAYENLP